MNSEPSVGSTINKSKTNCLLVGKNVIDTLSIQTQSGVVLDCERQTPYKVSGADVGLPEVLIQTTGEYIQEMTDFADKKKRMTVVGWMKHLDSKIKSQNVDAVYAAGGDAWRDFCSDIVDYYCFRFRVFKIPMPVVSESASTEQTEHSSEAAAPCATEAR